MWIAIGITLLCFGMAIHPILSLVPTKAQKYKIKMRQAAFAQGLSIDIRLPELDESLQNQYDFSEQAIYRLQPDRALETPYLLALRSKVSGDWFWVKEQRPPAKLIEPLIVLYNQLPDKIKAVEHSEVGSGVCFNEFGSVDQLTTLKAHLSDLNQLFLDAQNE